MAAAAWDYSTRSPRTLCLALLICFVWVWYGYYVAPADRHAVVVVLGWLVVVIASAATAISTAFLVSFARYLLRYGRSAMAEYTIELTDEHIAKIIETYQQRPEKIERYSRRVEMEEIEENGFNLNISRYVSTVMPEEPIDLRATHAELVQLLLESGANPNQVEQTGGFTALIWAAQLGHAASVERLLAAGADPTVRAFDGRSAEDWAAANGHGPVLALLPQPNATSH